MRYPVFVGFILAASAASLACSPSTQAQSAQPAQQSRGNSAAPVPVSVAQVVQKAMPFGLNVIGTVEPASTVSVHAQVTGQLTSVTFKEGDDVREGAVLFQIDPRPLEAAVKQAEANLQRDTAQASNAKAISARTADLAARGIATAEQLETARAGADALNATIEADRAALENARIQLQYATIKAPLTGRTGSLMVHAGSLLRANDTTPLVIINQIAPINVSFAVPEAQFPSLRRYLAKGTVPLSVETPDGPSGQATGRITFMDNAVDPTTGTIRVKGSFANTNHTLWPGQFVNVNITLSTDAAAIVVPSTAVQTGQQGTYVFVVKEDRTTDLRNVVVNRTAGDETIIASGLAANETVVTDGQLRLVPGSRVTVKAAGESGQ